MDQTLVLFVGLVDVDVSEVSHVRLHHSFSDVDVDNCLFVSQCQNRVPVFLILVSEVGDHLVFLELHFSIFGLEVNVDFSRFLSRNLDENDTFGAGFFRKTFSLGNQLFALV